VVDAQVNALVQALRPEVRGAVIALVADGLFTARRAL